MKLVESGSSKLSRMKLLFAHSHIPPRLKKWVANGKAASSSGHALLKVLPGKLFRAPALHGPHGPNLLANPFGM